MPELQFLQLALNRARECTPVVTAFSVGCVITIPNPNTPDSLSNPLVFATGFSRELPGNTHAEANALEKSRQLSSFEISSLLSLEPSAVVPSIDELLATADVYTTMEPCSVRLSGLSPCADALIAARVKRCIIGVGEPADFVQCEGARKLEDVGIEVIWMKDIEKECLEVARKGHPPS